MPWKPIVGQDVIANVDRQVRHLLASAWNSSTGAIRVAWPPHDPTGAAARGRCVESENEGDRRVPL